MRVLGAGGVVRVRTFTLGDREHLLGRHVEELGFRIDEFPNEPGACDAVRLRSLTCDPLQAVSFPGSRSVAPYVHRPCHWLPTPGPRDRRPTWPFSPITARPLSTRAPRRLGRTGPGRLLIDF